MSRKEGKMLLGICGVYCGACETYRAYNDKDQALVEWEIKMGMPKEEIYCKGCGSDLVNEWCAKCQFRKCVKKQDVELCFECKDFPCRKLVAFSKTRPHRTLGLHNLQQLKHKTVEEWLKQQEKRWSCSRCGKKLHWYAERCPNCGAKFVDATRESQSLPQKHFKDNAREKHMNMKKELIAPCGMNCAVCGSYLALKYDVKSKGIRISYCEGCRPRDKKCAFLKKRCELLLNNKIEFCYECKDFPCERLQHIDERCRMFFRMGFIDNLKTIKKSGMSVFLKAQKEKWQCPKCGEAICCHNGICFNCSLDKLKNKKKLYRWED